MGWFADLPCEADAAFLARVEELMIEADELSSSPAQYRNLQKGAPEVQATRET